MMKKHKKEISIDALAGMIQRGFEEVKKEQNKVEQSIRKEMRDMESGYGRFKDYRSPEQREKDKEELGE